MHPATILVLLCIVIRCAVVFVVIGCAVGCRIGVWALFSIGGMFWCLLSMLFILIGISDLSYTIPAVS